MVIGAQFEFALILWLLCARNPHYVRRVLLGTFTLFMLYSFVNGVLGNNSCGCFGQVPVDPFLSSLFIASGILLVVMSSDNESPMPALELPDADQRVRKS